MNSISDNTNNTNNTNNESSTNTENNLNIPQIIETVEESNANDTNSTTEKLEESDTVEADTSDPNLNINLLSILSPVVNDLDERINNVHLSQTQLNLILNQLLQNLKDFETSITPPLIQPSIDKLIKAKLRLNSINHTLLLVMDRLDKMQSLMQQQGK